MMCEVMDVAVLGVNGQMGHCLLPDEEHLFQPAEDLWVALTGFLDTLYNLLLHRILLRFGPCLRAAIGGFGKGSLSSGLSEIIVL